MRELGSEYDIAYAWAEEAVSPRDGVTTDQWCEKFGVQRCQSIGELCEKSDVIVILAPSDPDKHLPYAKAVLPFGKPTYIDKTFAPNVREAKEIFALAERYGTPFFSTSALRYAAELDAVPDCRQMAVTGSGSSVEEYIIHQIEMLVKKLGCGASAVSADGGDGLLTFRVRYPDDRFGMMTFAGAYPFTAYMSGGGTAYVTAGSDYFRALMADILRFFEEKTVSFDTAETLEVMKIREAALRAKASPDTWIAIE